MPKYSISTYRIIEGETVRTAIVYTDSLLHLESLFNDLVTVGGLRMIVSKDESKDYPITLSRFTSLLF